ncbi:uncharacterized protein LOC113206742 isoform X2 [Frankliniella occidentalis]|uniref:Uncharacterized protein LOC113206742 isoform X2 n=1 Tax=Frankliniella occidentalis TaxID=133901 RepID=A0A9C6X0Y0_FRAOC|nr:uncharacterized protein LOC113206742 isoform X2 [Frankliniella occidentalis]
MGSEQEDGRAPAPGEPEDKVPVKRETPEAGGEVWLDKRRELRDGLADADDGGLRPITVREDCHHDKVWAGVVNNWFNDTRLTGVDEDGARDGPMEVHAAAEGPHRTMAAVEVAPLIAEQPLPGDYTDEYGAVYRTVPKDGNCVFRALAERLFDGEKHHPVVRHGVASHVVDNWPGYAPLTRFTDPDTYLRFMELEGSPGGATELRAAAEAFYRTVAVVHDGVLEVVALRNDADPIVLRRTGAPPTVLYDPCVTLPAGGWKGGEDDLAKLDSSKNQVTPALADANSERAQLNEEVYDDNSRGCTSDSEGSLSLSEAAEHHDVGGDVAARRRGARRAAKLLARERLRELRDFEQFADPPGRAEIGESPEGRADEPETDGLETHTVWIAEEIDLVDIAEEQELTDQLSVGLDEAKDMLSEGSDDDCCILEDAGSVSQSSGPAQQLPPGTHIDEYGARYKAVRKDSNCVFRALADRLLGGEEHHQQVRCAVVNHVLKYWTPAYRRLTSFPDPDAYRRHMMLTGRGDAVEARAAAEAFNRTVAVVQDGVLRQVTLCRGPDPIVLRRAGQVGAEHYDVCVSLPPRGWHGGRADLRRVWKQPVEIPVDLVSDSDSDDDDVEEPHGVFGIGPDVLLANNRETASQPPRRSRPPRASPPLPFVAESADTAKTQSTLVCTLWAKIQQEIQRERSARLRGAPPVRNRWGRPWETPEQREERLSRARERARRRRLQKDEADRRLRQESETSEQSEASRPSSHYCGSKRTSIPDHREYMRIKMREYRRRKKLEMEAASPEEREAWRERERRQRALRRRRRRCLEESETPEQRAARERLRKMSESRAIRMQTETAEEREERLRKVREYQRKRYYENPEQCTARRKRALEYQLNRLAKETPEEHRERLRKMRERRELRKRTEEERGVARGKREKSVEEKEEQDDNEELPAEPCSGALGSNE